MKRLLTFLVLVGILCLIIAGLFGVGASGIYLWRLGAVIVLLAGIGRICAAIPKNYF